MSDTRMAPLTLEGWYMLHQGFRVAWPRLDELDPAARRDAASAFAETVASWADLGDDGWSGAYRVVGGELDLMLVHFRSGLEGLADAEGAVRRAAVADHLYLELDYLSVVELGLYRLTSETAEELRDAGTDPRSEEGRQRLDEAAREHATLDYVQDRLHPRQPDGMPYLCFYPMDKRREKGQNWYDLPLEERKRLMVEHGSIGRRYAGRVSQVISGSVGLDDWEWGVTLWSGDPLEFKTLVTEMRYDEVSARYAAFGPFYVGKRLAPDELRAELEG